MKPACLSVRVLHSEALAVNCPAWGYGLLQNGRASRHARLYAGRQEVRNVITELSLESDRWAGAALARRLAHELRNPLAPIATAAELLVHQTCDERVRHLGGIIERHAAQLRSLVDELIAAANSGTGLAFRAAQWAEPGYGHHAAYAPRHDSARQLSLPWHGETPLPHDAIEPDLKVPGTPALRILVVDDNADAAHLLGLFLQSLGHEVSVLSDPLAAVAAAADFLPQVGLLDIAMPGLDGHELARRLLQMPSSADLRLAAVTAYSQPSERQAATRSGFEQFFVKPLDVSALQDWLEQTQLSVVA
jgi:CheY-like chemotaxis protein